MPAVAADRAYSIKAQELEYMGPVKKKSAVEFVGRASGGGGNSGAKPQSSIFLFSQKLSPEITQFCVGLRLRPTTRTK